MKASPSNSPKTGLGPFNGVQLRPVAPLSNLMPTPPIDIGLSSDLFDGDGVAQTSRKDTLNGDDAGGDRDTLLNNVFAELNHELEKSSEEILADFMVKQRGGKKPCTFIPCLSTFFVLFAEQVEVHARHYISNSSDPFVLDADCLVIHALFMDFYVL